MADCAAKHFPRRVDKDSLLLRHRSTTSKNPVAALEVRLASSSTHASSSSRWAFVPLSPLQISSSSWGGSPGSCVCGTGSSLPKHVGPPQ